MAQKYFALSPSGVQHEFDIDDLLALFTRRQDWISFMRLAFTPDPITMTAVMEDGQTRAYQISRNRFVRFE